MWNYIDLIYTIFIKKKSIFSSEMFNTFKDKIILFKYFYIKKYLIIGFLFSKPFYEIYMSFFLLSKLFNSIKDFYHLIKICTNENRITLFYIYGKTTTYSPCIVLNNFNKQFFFFNRLLPVIISKINFETLTN